MKKLLSLSLLPVLLAGCSGLPGLDEPKTADAEKPFIIGAILPLSGEVASVGQSVRNGIELGLADLPEDVRAKIDVKFEDDQFEPMKTVTALKKLQMLDKPNAIITNGSTTSNAATPLAEKAELPMVAIAASERSIVDERRWIVKHWVVPATIVRPAAAEAKKRYHKIAVAVAIHDGMLAVNDALRAELGTGIIALESRFQPDENNYKTFALQAREAGVDAIALLLLPNQIGLFAKQAREQGYEGEFFGVANMENANAVKLAGGALANAWYAQASDPTGDFLTKYQATYPDAGFFAAANAYDTIRIIADAVSEFTPGMTDEEKRAAVNEKLHTLKDYSGAAGTYSASGENDFTLPAMLKVVTASGEFVPLDGTSELR